MVSRVAENSDNVSIVVFLSIPKYEIIRNNLIFLLFKESGKMDSKEDVCITGISGRFPECDNVEDFFRALFDGKDLVTTDDRRFKAGKNFPFYWVVSRWQEQFLELTECFRINTELERCT